MDRFLITLLAFLTACGSRAAQEPHSSDQDSSTMPSAASESPNLSAFKFEKTRDPMTDSDRSFVYDTAVGPSGMGRPAAIIWRCDGRDMEFVISAADFLTTSNPVSVQLRFDDLLAEAPSEWPVSTEGTAVFASDPIRIAVTEAALKVSRLRARLTDYQGTYHDYEFNLDGVASALDSLKCTLELARKRVASAQQERERRIASAQRERKRLEDSIRLARTRAADFPKESPWVGYPATREYMPTTSPCWREFTDSATSVFFKTEAAAKANGYSKSTFCR